MSCLLRAAPAILLLAVGLTLPAWLVLRAVDSVKPTHQTEPSRQPAPKVESQATSSEVSVNEPSITHKSPSPAVISESDCRDTGLRHIATLQQTGNYRSAADLATTSAQEYRRDFTIAAFHEWGRTQPEQAIASAIRIDDSVTREFAIQSVFSGWARSDPEGMAEAALAFPDGSAKKIALTKAMRAWMIKDPILAGDWIVNHSAAIAVADEMFTKDRR